MPTMPCRLTAKRTNICIEKKTGRYVTLEETEEAGANLLWPQHEGRGVGKSISRGMGDGSRKSGLLRMRGLDEIRELTGLFIYELNLVVHDKQAWKRKVMDVTFLSVCTLINKSSAKL